MTTSMLPLVFTIALTPQGIFSPPTYRMRFPPTSQSDTRTRGPVDERKTRPKGSKVDEELIHRLLGGQTSIVDAMERTLSRMEDASQGLLDRLDVGEETQRAQKDILTGINQLIEEASKNRPSSRDRSSSVRRRQERPEGRSTPGDFQKAASQGKAPPAASRPTDPGQAGRREKGKGDADKSDLARGWGFLPQRDREEISQGFDEQFPAKYRERILEYYRQLAEEAKRNGE